MQLLINLSNLILPALFFSIILYGLYKKTNVYDEFLKGALDGMKTVLQIMPTMVGLMLSVGFLSASGFLDFLAGLLHKLLFFLPVPATLYPLLLVKMFSSSAATGLLLSIFKSYGPDSKIGIVTSLIMSSTETIFYTMSVYFLTANIKKTRYTLPGALIATLAGILASFFLVSYL